MINNDCRCPGCGTCDAAAEIVPIKKTNAELRKKLREEGQRYSELERMTHSYIERLHATERERDELKTRLAHAEADAEQAIHNEAFNERQRIAAWLRARVAHLSLDSRTTMQALDALRTVADEVERGEHER